MRCWIAKVGYDDGNVQLIERFSVDTYTESEARVKIIADAKGCKVVDEGKFILPVTVVEGECVEVSDK